MKLKSCFFLLLAVVISCTNHTQSIKINYVNSANALLNRLLPDQIDKFKFEQIPPDFSRDVFEIESKNNLIIIRGNNAVSMAMGLNWYLKYYCMCDVSLFGNQLNLPNELAKVYPKIRQTSLDKYRYILNYCSFGYTLAWYNWEQWERLIDWMALNGINMPLAVTGQEAVWVNVANKLGISDLSDFLAGPPFLPFGWMGCLDGWGGPLPESWIKSHVELQNKILARERELGMTPVLQGFTGHVPKTFVDKFQCNVQKIKWLEWETYMLDPLDPNFQKIADLFIEEQTKLYGTDHYYAADSFIEMTPPSGDPEYLSSLAKAILHGMSAGDSQAVWLLQGWTFINQKDFWTPERTDAFLTAVPNEHIILLDLFCESLEVWRQTNSFYGKPWVWCNIQSFGANNFLHGPLNQINERLDKAGHDPGKQKLTGIGFVNEGFEGNPVVYEFLTEMAWHNQKVEMNDWLNSYAHARYGAFDENIENAWKNLYQSVYRDEYQNTIFFSSFRYPRTDFDQSLPYDQSILIKAWGDMLKSAEPLKNVDTYRYDLTAVGLQVLGGFSHKYHVELVDAFKKKDKVRFHSAAVNLLSILKDMDKLAATRKETMLGTWLEDAKRWGTTPQEKELFEWNARRVLTLWGETDILRDYSRRNWAGMLSSFYIPRWEMFIESMLISLENNTPFDEKAVNENLVKWELGWADKKDVYPTEPIGDSIEISRELWGKFGRDETK